MNDGLSKNRKKLAAVVSVAIVLLAGTVVMVNDDNVVEESEAFPFVAVGVLLLWGISVGAGYYMGTLSVDDSTEVENRSHEADILAESLSAGVSYYVNSLSQYANIWGLTNDHWERQAELSATALWDGKTAFDTNRILEGSGAYTNIGQLMSNVAAQVNEHWEDVGERTAQWNDYVEIYGSGKMKLAVSFDGDTKGLEASAGQSFTLRIGGVATAEDGSDRVWIQDGSLYSSKDSEIVIELKDGGKRSINLRGGQWNDLGSDFEAGIYKLEEGVTYCGNITGIYGDTADPATVTAGAVAMVNGKNQVFTCTNFVEGTSNYKPECDVQVGSDVYDHAQFRIIVEETENSRSIDITDVLARYQMLLNETQNSLIKANVAANVVWNIYDAAGESNPFLTSLMVPDNYKGVELTVEQRQMITTVAMWDLYEYWDRNGTDASLDECNIELTPSSLFCRGDIKIGDYAFTGVDGTKTDTTVEYKDVIFTPIFYENTILRVGNNQIDQDYYFVMIWSSEGQPLNTFKVENAQSADIKFLGSNDVLNITSMYYDGEPVSSIDLTTEMTVPIDPDTPDIKPTPSGTPDNDTAELIRLIMFILGGILIMWGAYQRNIIVIILGVAVVCFGILGSEWLEDKLWTWKHWRFVWPGS